MNARTAVSKDLSEAAASKDLGKIGADRLGFDRGIASRGVDRALLDEATGAAERIGKKAIGDIESKASSDFTLNGMGRIAGDVERMRDIKGRLEKGLSEQQVQSAASRNAPELAAAHGEKRMSQVGAEKAAADAAKAAADKAAAKSGLAMTQAKVDQRNLGFKDGKDISAEYRTTRSQRLEEVRNDPNHAVHKEVAMINEKYGAHPNPDASRNKANDLRELFDKHNMPHGSNESVRRTARQISEMDIKRTDFEQRVVKALQKQSAQQGAPMTPKEHDEVHKWLQEAATKSNIELTPRQVTDLIKKGTKLP